VLHLNVSKVDRGIAHGMRVGSGRERGPTAEALARKSYAAGGARLLAARALSDASALHVHALVSPNNIPSRLSSTNNNDRCHSKAMINQTQRTGGRRIGPVHHACMPCCICELSSYPSLHPHTCEA